MVFEVGAGVRDGEAEFGLDGAEHGSFEAGKGKIKVCDLGVGERVFGGVAGLSSFGDGGSARVGEAENFGDLVKAFADCII